jgi:hypothetical protein
MLKSNGKCLNVEREFRNKYERTIYCKISSILLHGYSDRAVIYLDDITWLKKAVEDAIYQSKSQANFVANISHGNDPLDSTS